MEIIEMDMFKGLLVGSVLFMAIGCQHGEDLALCQKRSQELSTEIESMRLEMENKNRENEQLMEITEILIKEIKKIAPDLQTTTLGCGSTKEQKTEKSK